MLVQALLAEGSVEALDEGTPRGLARLDKVEIQVSRDGPAVQEGRYKFRPVVHGNSLRQLIKIF